MFSKANKLIEPYEILHFLITNVKIILTLFQKSFVLQILLHEPGTRPLLTELGFAISPGFETLVSVNYEQVR